MTIDATTWIRHYRRPITIILVALTASTILLYTLGQMGAFDDTNEESFNNADIMFMSMMIIHHDQAIQMAELAANRTDNENILQLAQNISQAQQEENRKMADWLRQLGYERPRDGHRMAGMASAHEMEQLRNSTGAEFDRRFARLMITHHRGGIQMARSFAERGQNAELIDLEEQMIATQQREIERMQEWGLVSQ
ncbi:MAG: DUF305 domain-containing protein [Candidatus Nanohaloarchaeota archaeon QJJ-5]|nr:DUF305 domain-containing protein [Candidatus Nanohaloarchaeota archaeon QJJ-5]